MYGYTNALTLAMKFSEYKRKRPDVLQNANISLADFCTTIILFFHTSEQITRNYILAKSHFIEQIIMGT